MKSVTKLNGHKSYNVKVADYNGRRSLVGCLATAAVALIAGQTLDAAQSPDSDGNQPKLSLTIRCTNMDLKAGDEIPVEFIIKNEGTTDYKYADRTYDRSGRMNEYALVAKTTAGEKVPDPRAANKYGWFGGGLFNYAVLHPGESYSKVIPLNRWALVKEAGKYTVTGTYQGERSPTNGFSIVSDPITINVRQRSDKEMQAYIRDLAKRIEKLPKPDPLNLGNRPPDALQGLVMSLMYTCDPRIVPILLKTEWEYADDGFWETEALEFYVPHSPETKKAILEVSMKHGLTRSTQALLSGYSCTSEEMFPIIERSLAPDNPQGWAAGANAAVQYANDAFTPRLIAIATSVGSQARMPAIFALALNRTDNGVKSLKTLLDDPDQNIRDQTENAIRAAYIYRGIATGRPMKPGDFDAQYQKPK